jgi:hypothetical protein
MKKFFLMVALLGAASFSANADVCNPADIDYDPIQCAATGGGAGGGPGGPGGPSGVPIDGGLSILLASGAAMGARRFMQARKKTA